jgi:hypothetical protein
MAPNIYKIIHFVHKYEKIRILSVFVFILSLTEGCAACGGLTRRQKYLNKYYIFIKMHDSVPAPSKPAQILF